MKKVTEYDCFKKRWISDFCAKCEARLRCSARAWEEFASKRPDLVRIIKKNGKKSRCKRS